MTDIEEIFGASQWLDVTESYRLADETGLRIRDGFAEVVNVRSGRRTVVPAIPALLHRFLEWTTIPDALVAAIACDPTARLGEMLVAVAVLRDLEVLISSREERRGDRLTSPGPRWESALRFLAETRTTRDTTYLPPATFTAQLDQKARYERQPSAFHERGTQPRHVLPNPLPRLEDLDTPFATVLLNRRTSRRYAGEPITSLELSRLIYFTWGATALIPNPMGDFFLRKTSPGGGSIHSVEAYPIVLDVEGVPPGIYHYVVRCHALEPVALGDQREWLAAACGDQTWIEEAAVVFASTAFLPRMSWKYDFSRALRVVIADAGHISQTFGLVATWIGLGSFTTCALRDEVFEERLGLDPVREPILVVNGAGRLEPPPQDSSRPRAEGDLWER